MSKSNSETLAQAICNKGFRGNGNTQPHSDFGVVDWNATRNPYCLQRQTGSVVTKDIKKPGIYVGNPAKLIRSL